MVTQSWWDGGCAASISRLGWAQDSPHSALSESAQPGKIGQMKSQNGHLNPSVQATDPAFAESRVSPHHPTQPCATADLEAVYVRHVESIYWFLYRRVGNCEDAEELTGKVFLKASQELDLSRSDASIAAWLFAVARTVLADHWLTYYRSGSGLPFDDLLEYPDTNSETLTLQHSTSEHRVAAILHSLNPQQRRVLELRFLRGCSVQETAEALGITPGNVKVLQCRALARAVQVDADLPPSGPPSRASGQCRSPGSRD